jgi:hypothetical protein
LLIWNFGLQIADFSIASGLKKSVRFIDIVSIN